MNETDFFLLEVIADADVIEVTGYVDETMSHRWVFILRQNGLGEVVETFVERLFQG